MFQLNSDLNQKLKRNAYYLHKGRTSQSCKFRNEQNNELIATTFKSQNHSCDLDFFALTHIPTIFTSQMVAAAQ